MDLVKKSTVLALGLLLSLVLSIAGCVGSQGSSSKQNINNSRTIEQLVDNLMRCLDTKDSVGLAAMHTDPYYQAVIDDDIHFAEISKTRADLEEEVAEAWESPTRPSSSLVGHNAKISGDTAVLTLTVMVIEGESEEEDHTYIDEWCFELRKINGRWYIHKHLLEF